MQYNYLHKTGTKNPKADFLCLNFKYDIKNINCYIH